ncbi:MAG TPA: hypothetical protein VF516_10270 [Kofleriaceae bacterium]
MLTFGDRLEVLQLGIPPEEVVIKDRLPDDILDQHDRIVVQRFCCTARLLYNKIVGLNPRI